MVGISGMLWGKATLLHRANILEGTTNVFFFSYCLGVFIICCLAMCCHFDSSTLCQLVTTLHPEYTHAHSERHY